MFVWYQIMWPITRNVSVNNYNTDQQKMYMILLIILDDVLWIKLCMLRFSVLISSVWRWPRRNIGSPHGHTDQTIFATVATQPAFIRPRTRLTRRIFEHGYDLINRKNWYFWAYLVNYVYREVVTFLLAAIYACSLLTYNLMSLVIF